MCLKWFLKYVPQYYNTLSSTIIHCRSLPLQMKKFAQKIMQTVLILKMHNLNRQISETRFTKRNGRLKSNAFSDQLIATQQCKPQICQKLIIGLNRSFHFNSENKTILRLDQFTLIKQNQLKYIFVKPITYLTTPIPPHT